MNNLRELAPVIDAKKMLKLFVREFNTENGHTHVTEEFVIELFNECGINDAEIAKHLFRLVRFKYLQINISIHISIMMIYCIFRWIGIIMAN